LNDESTHFPASSWNEKVLSCLNSLLRVKTSFVGGMHFKLTSELVLAPRMTLEFEPYAKHSKSLDRKPVFWRENMRSLKLNFVDESFGATTIVVTTVSSALHCTIKGSCRLTQFMQITELMNFPEFTFRLVVVVVVVHLIHFIFVGFICTFHVGALSLGFGHFAAASNEALGFQHSLVNGSNDNQHDDCECYGTAKEIEFQLSLHFE